MSYFSSSVKPILILLGLLSLSLGLLGIVLPVLPTTPFLLLSAYLFLHSSPRLYNWLVNHRYFGKYIRDYQEHRVIPRRVKIIALTTLWLTISLSIVALGESHILIDILLLIIAVGVSWHILSFSSTIKK